MFSTVGILVRLLLTIEILYFDHMRGLAYIFISQVEVNVYILKSSQTETYTIYSDRYVRRGQRHVYYMYTKFCSLTRGNVDGLFFIPVTGSLLRVNSH